MSKLKRMRRKRAAQKKANIRLMTLHREEGGKLGSHKLLKRMTRDHQDVLQNIEFVLVSGYCDDGDIDDCIIAEALRAAIRDEAPESARAQSLNESLKQIREFRADVSDEIWRDGLRTVLQSVQRHSSLRPGSRAYLNFVAAFVP